MADRVASLIPATGRLRELPRALSRGAGACLVTQVASGMILDMRPHDCHDPVAPCMIQSEAVARRLGVSPDSPVSLLAD